jgi:hypothetical protein
VFELFILLINERLKPQENINKYKYWGMATVKLTLNMRMKRLLYIQSDHKKTPQLPSFPPETEFQRAVHHIKGFQKHHKLDTKYCPQQPHLARVKDQLHSFKRHHLIFFGTARFTMSLRVQKYSILKCYSNIRNK